MKLAKRLRDRPRPHGGGGSVRLRATACRCSSARAARWSPKLPCDNPKAGIERYVAKVENTPRDGAEPALAAGSCRLIRNLALKTNRSTA